MTGRLTPLVALLVATVSCADPSVVFPDEPTTRLARSTLNPRTLEGYADHQSVRPGDTIKFYLHHRSRAETTLSIVRFGKVGSPGTGVIGEQRIPFPSSGRLEELRTVAPRALDPDAVSRGANWEVSAEDVSVRVPIAPAGSPESANWRSGYFALKMQTREAGVEFVNYVPFVVLPDDAQRNRPTIVAATNTWVAYNFWPQVVDSPQNFRSLSVYPGVHTREANDNAIRYERPSGAAVVSVRRPNPNASPLVINLGAPRRVETVRMSTVRVGRAKDGFSEELTNTEHLLLAELRLAMWFELQELPYNVITDSEFGQPTLYAMPVASNPIVVFAGHSEYWTEGMRSRAARHLARGGSIINLSGNVFYWRTSVINGQLRSEGRWRDASHRTPLLGIEASLQSTGTCAGFMLRTFAGSDAHVLAGDALGLVGTAGVMDLVPARHSQSWEPFVESTARSYCNAVRAWYQTVPASSEEVMAAGAAGGETDAAARTPGLFRQFNVIGAANVSNGATDGTPMSAGMLYARRTSAGQVFTAGSILFSQSLLLDHYSGASGGPLTRLLRGMLERWNGPSFSDFSGDGEADIVGFIGSKMYSYEISGGRVQPRSAPVDWSRWIYEKILTAGDFNGNRTSDIVGIDRAGVAWLHENRNPESRTSIGGGFPTREIVFAPGDLDGDGGNDIVARRGDELLLFRGDGDGGLRSTTPSVMSAGWSAFTAIAPAGDANGDGLQDLFATRASGGAAGQIVLVRGHHVDGVGNVLQPSEGLVVSDDSEQNRRRRVLSLGRWDSNDAPDFALVDANGDLRLCLDPVLTGAAVALSSTRCPVIDDGWNIYSALSVVW